MEVHHAHSSPGHHPAPSKKKWTQHLWEFLMLFLAVFCGFLAENIREKKVERHREQEFAKQLVLDLQLDTTRLGRTIQRLKKHDSLFLNFLSVSTDSSPRSDAEILSAASRLMYTYDFPLVSATYEQMKYSGSLRYIRSSKVVQELQKYYEQLMPRLRDYANHTFNYFDHNISPFLNKHTITQDFDFFEDTLVNKKTGFINKTSTTKQEMINVFMTYNSDLQAERKVIFMPCRRKADSLIVMLKKEYHLD